MPYTVCRPPPYLRGQLDLNVAAQIRLFKHCILAHIRANHASDLPISKEQPEPGVLQSRIVADDRQLADVLVACERPDQVLWHPAQPKAADQQRRARCDGSNGLVRRQHRLPVPGKRPSLGGGKGTFVHKRCKPGHSTTVHCCGALPIGLPRSSLIGACPCPLA